MKFSRSKKLSVLVAIGLAAIIATPAMASVSVTVSHTRKLTDYQVVRINLANVPAGQGVYIAQCFKPEIAQRSASGLICNGSVTEQGSMIWATTDGSRGSQSATAELALMLRSSFSKTDSNNKTTTYECGISNCAIFVYRDHRGLSDTSLDTIVPLRFLPKQDVSIADLGLKKSGSKYVAGTMVSLNQSVTTSKAQAIDFIIEETEPVCRVKPTVPVSIYFRKVGVCELTITAPGSSTFDEMIKVVTYTVVAGK